MDHKTRVAQDKRIHNEKNMVLFSSLNKKMSENNAQTTKNFWWEGRKAFPIVFFLSMVDLYKHITIFIMCKENTNYIFCSFLLSRFFIFVFLFLFLERVLKQTR